MTSAHRHASPAVEPVFVSLTVVLVPSPGHSFEDCVLSDCFSAGCHAERRIRAAQLCSFVPGRSKIPCHVSCGTCLN